MTKANQEVRSSPSRGAILNLQLTSPSSVMGADQEIVGHRVGTPLPRPRRGHPYIYEAPRGKAARETHNPLVEGSSPSGPTIHIEIRRFVFGIKGSESLGVFHCGGAWTGNSEDCPTRGDSTHP